MILLLVITYIKKIESGLFSKNIQELNMTIFEGFLCLYSVYNQSAFHCAFISSMIIYHL